MNHPFIIHVYTQCWNEEVILPHFLRHYRDCQKITVFDHYSDDSSGEILARQSHVEVKKVGPDGVLTQDLLLQFKNHAWKQSRGRADYVIVCDTDEFLYHPNLGQLLARMKQQGATIMLPQGFQMLGQGALKPSDNILTSISQGYRDHIYDKCVLFDPNEVDEINFRVGAHICDPIGKIKYFREPGLALLHYRYLSAEYAFRRNQLILERKNQQDKDRGFSRHQMRSLTEIKSRFSYYQNNSVNVHSLFAQEMRSSAPDDLEHATKAALIALKNKQYPLATAIFQKISNWHPDHFMAGIGLTCLLYERLGLLNETVFKLRRTAALRAKSCPIKQCYLEMADQFDQLGFDTLSQRCQILAESN